MALSTRFTSTWRSSSRSPITGTKRSRLALSTSMSRLRSASRCSKLSLVSTASCPSETGSLVNLSPRWIWSMYERLRTRRMQAVVCPIRYGSRAVTRRACSADLVKSLRFSTSEPSGVSKWWPMA